MGRVSGPYGVKGWIKARTYSASPAALLDHASWWLAGQGGGDAWQEFSVLSARVHADSVIAALGGLADREATAPWRGALIGVPRKALPKLREGEIYWSDLVGFAVVNRAGQVLGAVSGLLDTAAHPVLRVAGEDGSERLIPLVEAYVDAIEAAARRIVVDWQQDF
jgi:16S rRNA processing protein RimM